MTTKHLLFIHLIFLASFACGQDKKYSCITRYNFSLKQRLQNYPFNIAKQVMLVSYPDSLRELPENANHVIIPGMRETKILDNEQIDSLTYLLYNISTSGNRFAYNPAACYLPKNAIVFIDSAGITFEYIEICFECRKMRVSSNKIHDGYTCNEKLKLIKTYFNRQGILYGTSEEQ